MTPKIIVIHEDESMFGLLADRLGIELAETTTELHINVTDVKQLRAYPFDEGENYWTIENDGFGKAKIIESIWDWQSEESHTKDSVYYTTMDKAIVTLVDEADYIYVSPISGDVTKYWFNPEIGKFELDELEDEEVDLIEHYNLLPKAMQDLLRKHTGNYKHNDKMLEKAKKLGYTFEYDLSGGLYNLKKLTEFDLGDEVVVKEDWIVKDNGSDFNHGYVCGFEFVNDNIVVAISSIDDETKISNYNPSELKKLF